MAPAEPLMYLALNRISFLRPREKLTLAEIFPTPAPFLRLTLSELQGLLGRRVKSRDWNPGAYLEEAEADQNSLTERGISCTFYGDRDYPPQLAVIFDPPLVLYYRGRLPDYERPLVAVVGTRRPTGAARSAAYSLCFDLAQRGIGTVSGLARGIDIEAHRGSLDGGGFTIAVLGNGIDRIFPGSSKIVGRRILETRGLIVSEYPQGTPPHPYHFPARNRIISGLARTVVVIQAPGRSGALITADYALHQGRNLGVHQVGLDGVVGRGTQKLADEGALIVGSAEEVLEDWSWVDPGCRDASGRAAPRGPEVQSDWEEELPLARLMELELADRLTRSNGEIYIKKLKKECKS